MGIVTAVKATVVLIALFKAASLNGEWHFMLDNLSSFRVHFALAFLCCSVFFLIARQPLWTVFSGVGLLASLALIVPWYLAPETGSRSTGGEELKIVSFNVSPRNDDHAGVTRLVREAQPDILGLIEITPSFLEKIGPALQEFPYRYEAPEQKSWGLALYSKYRLSDASLIRLRDDLPPIITATLQMADANYEVVLVHPYPPMNAKLTELRNAHLEEMARYIARSGRPALVLGDLNIAMWSPYYRDFVKKAGLTNARRGAGVQSTWPPSRVLGVPIDHILHSDSITSSGFAVLPGAGSDHLPIAARVKLGSENAGSE